MTCMFAVIAGHGVLRCELPLGVLTGDVGRIYAIRPYDEDLQCGMGSALIHPSHTGGLLWFTLTQRSRPDTDFK